MRAQLLKRSESTTEPETVAAPALSPAQGFRYEVWNLGKYFVYAEIAVAPNEADITVVPSFGRVVELQTLNWGPQ